MKYYSFAISGLTLFTLFLLLPGEVLQAQYVSYKNEDGSNKTPEQRKAEEASNKQKNTQYKPSTSSTPGTTTEKESLTKEERFKQSRIDQAKRDAIIKNVPTGGVVYDAVDWEAGDNDSRRVQLKGKWGMIDKTGKIIIPVQYKTLGLLKCGICPVKDEKNNDWYFLDNTGKENSPDRYTNISATSICWDGELNGKWASVYKLGPATLAYNVNDISEGLIVAGMQRKRGFVDLNGKIIIPLEYNQVHPFTNGLACVQKGTALFDPWGAINPAGKVVIPIIYEFAFSFANGRAAVKIGGSWGYIDKTGETVIPFIYEHARNFSDGIAAVSIKTGGKTGLAGFIDMEGKIIASGFDQVNDFSEGLAAVRKNEKWGFIDKTIKTVIQKKYKDVFNFSGGLARVQLNYKWGYINTKGEEVIPTEFDNIGEFANGTAKAVLVTDTFYFDKTGKQTGGNIKFISKVSPAVKNAPYYDTKGEFSEGLAVAGVDGKYGYIDENKKEIVPLIYDVADDFHEGMAVVKIGYTAGFIDKSGKLVIPLNYFSAGRFVDGIACVSIYVPSGGLLWGYIDKANQVILPLIYDHVTMLENGKIQAKLKGKTVYFDKTGKKVKK